MRARLCALSFAVLAACGDRSPPALWPEAPPPTLAKPIGIDTSVHATTDATGASSTADADGAPDAKGEPSATSADQPYPANGESPAGAPPNPHERLPMPLL